ncbi:MAG: hypothetical protein AMJ84_03000 [Acidithiobacillales bacterium SM23_46]|nr:MAG: hypothetical protein AMJ84_03000 [Acidithiobacillales bacterium SM23_46]KPL27880.1 MAG: hypothetical protein AMJ72_06315 [Acidithiobacillales bacterium SM1_46]
MKVIDIIEELQKHNPSAEVEFIWFRQLPEKGCDIRNDILLRFEPVADAPSYYADLQTGEKLKDVVIVAIERFEPVVAKDT